MFSISSMNALYYMQENQKQMDNLLVQAQTGKRINKAADDSSGMVISDNLRTQANSLSQGTKNAMDAQNLLNVVDGSLSTYKETLGLMKDKAISAASDVSSPESRLALQNDINSLMKSLDNIANETSFNGIKLLNGTFTNKQFQVGAYSNQTVGISLSSVDTSKIGHLNETVTNVGVSAGTTASDLTINGATIGQVTISDTTKDGANLLADSINLATDKTGVKATAYNEVKGTTITGGSLADGDLKINGVSIGAVNFNENDNTNSLINAINSVTSQTGVTAYLEAGKLVLKSDGENIHITEANGGAAKAGLTAGENYGKVTLTNQNAISIENATSVSGLDDTSTTNYTLEDLDLRSQEGAQKAIEILDNALSEIDTVAADVGSVTNQLDRIISVNNVTETNVRAAENTISGADLEEITKELNDLNIKYQSSLYALSQSNQLQQNVLTLLR